MLEMKLKKTTRYEEKIASYCFTESVYEVGNFTVHVYTKANHATSFCITDNREICTYVDIWAKLQYDGAFNVYDACVSFHKGYDMAHLDEYIAALKEAKELIETISAVFGIKYDKVEIK